MAKSSQSKSETSKDRYEYRVWGEHPKARKKLERMATKELHQTIEDCYLLGEDPDFNAKVRNDTLKVKQLVGTDRGFERWSSEWHDSSDTAPKPYDDLFNELGLDRPQRGKSWDILKAVAQLDPDTGARAVFVTKHRIRYRIGSIRAEVTDVDIHGSDEVLRSLSIEGDDLDELVSLRKQLGLRKAENTPMHVAIDSETDDSVSTTDVVDTVDEVEPADAVESSDGAGTADDVDTPDDQSSVSTVPPSR